MCTIHPRLRHEVAAVPTANGLGKGEAAAQRVRSQLTRSLSFAFEILGQTRLGCPILSISLVPWKVGEGNGVGGGGGGEKKGKGREPGLAPGFQFFCKGQTPDPTPLLAER